MSIQRAACFVGRESCRLPLVLASTERGIRFGKTAVRDTSHAANILGLGPPGPRLGLGDRFPVSCVVLFSSPAQTLLRACACYAPKVPERARLQQFAKPFIPINDDAGNVRCQMSLSAFTAALARRANPAKLQHAYKNQQWRGHCGDPQSREHARRDASTPSHGVDGIYHAPGSVDGSTRNLTSLTSL